MGVKYLHSWLEESTNIEVSRTPNVDYLCVDLNGVIHQAVENVYRRNIKTNFIDEVVNEVRIRVDQMILFKPEKEIVFAMDGVSPRAKHYRQRQRRFLAEDRNFDRNEITAGTTFMNRFSTEFLKIKWKTKCKISVSTSFQPGEGEHKIAAWIRKKDKETFLIVSEDSDMVLISCLIDKKIYILRSEKVLDISLLKKQLSTRLYDFVVFSCFLGNDFIPPLPTFSIRESSSELGALDFFFSLKEKPLIDKKTGVLHIDNVKWLLSQFVKREENIKKYRLQSLEGSTRCQNNSDLGSPLNYLKTVQWVCFYYFQGCPSWSWCYNHAFAPNLSDIIMSDFTTEKITEFQLSTPPTTEEQMIAVLPKHSSKLIHENNRERFENQSFNFRKEIDETLESVIVFL